MSNVSAYVIRARGDVFEVFSADGRLITSFSNGELADALQAYQFTAKEIARGMRRLCLTGFLVKVADDFDGSPTGATVAGHLITALVRACCA